MTIYENIKQLESVGEVKPNSLIHGECIEAMRFLADKSIDMILARPPLRLKNGTTACKWDIIIPFDKLWEQYNRVIKDNGAIVLFAQTPFDKVLGCSNIKNLKYEWIWEKESGTGFLNAKKMPLKSHENILIFYKKLPIYNPQMIDGKLYKSSYSNKNLCSTNYGNAKDIEPVEKVYDKRYPKTILKFKRDKNRLHPTQKPVKLLEYLIKTYTYEGETVLDNCMGSGSTGVACVNTNRKFIGIEMDEKYYDISCKRIKEAINEKKQLLF